MSWTWDPQAERVIANISTGSFDETDDPVGLIHTTEGVSILGAVNAYRAGKYWPHVTFGPDPGKVKTAKRAQHLPYTSRATTLSDDPGGIRPNRSGPVYQAEVVGFCDPAKKSSPWYIHNWPDWYRDQLAELMWDWEQNLHIPRRCTVTFRAYPGSYGRGASQRLSGTLFRNYSGWLGHQHAPENSHGDPGDFYIAEMFNRMKRFDPPEEDDMANADDVMRELGELRAYVEETYKDTTAKLNAFDERERARDTEIRAAVARVEGAATQIDTNLKQLMGGQS